MTFVVPKINPDSFDWLAQQDPDAIPLEHFVACVADYVRHNVEQGQDPAWFGDPYTFARAGDLQDLSTVVSWWPVDTRCPVRKPTLCSMVTHIRSSDPSKHITFAQALQFERGRVEAWLRDNGGNPDNPNETVKERNNRLAAARMRKMRGKIAENDISDPAEMALVTAVRKAKENLAAGKKYVRDTEARAKDAYDAAVLAAKVARAATVSEAQAWLPSAAQAVQDAEAALDNYRSGN